MVDLAGTYSNRTDLLQQLADLGKHIEGSGPRRSRAPLPRASGGPKKQLTPEEAAEIVAKYQAGASMAQLKVEHHMAKRTVAKVLRKADVIIRPKGGQERSEPLWRTEPGHRRRGGVRQDGCMSNPNGQLSIRTTGSPDDLIQLLDWFGRDDALRGRVRLEPPPVQDGQMGDLYQVLTVALSSGGTATALASALKAWFTTRRSDLVVTISRPDGTEMKVDAKRVNSHDVLSDLTALAESRDAPQ